MAPPIHPSPFDRIYADVRKDVPSIAQAVVQQELFRVMDDFTQRTNIWQEEVPVPILPNVVSYDINGLVTDGKINRLMFVYDANATTKHWPRSGISMRVPGILSLYYPPTTAASWVAVVAKRTTEPFDADTGYPVIDDWIVEKYGDTIGRGILARLQFEPQKPYSNPMLAQANQRAYYAGCSQARANDGHTNVFNGQNWLYPQGWGTVNRKPWA
jgi:hypothetical protein